MLLSQQCQSCRFQELLRRMKRCESLPQNMVKEINSCGIFTTQIVSIKMEIMASRAKRCLCQLLSDTRVTNANGKGWKIAFALSMPCSRWTAWASIYIWLMKWCYGPTLTHISVCSRTLWNFLQPSVSFCTFSWEPVFSERGHTDSCENIQTDARKSLKLSERYTSFSVHRLLRAIRVSTKARRWAWYRNQNKKTMEWHKYFHITLVS